MNILITGVNGFIGRALWDHFKDQRPSLNVFGIDLQIPIPRPRLWACDLSNQRQLMKILDRVRPDVIFHLAGGRPADENMLWQANFISTKTLFNVVAGLKSVSLCVVIPGSAAEYGQVKTPRRPVAETLQPQPLGWYGFIKYMQTSLGLMYARKGLDVRVARIFNIGGYGTPASLALGNFAGRIVRIEKGKEPPVLEVGQLSGQRDFVDIEDVCGALWAIARKGKRGEVYNVCSGRSSRMRSLLRELIRYSDIKDNVVIQEEQKTHAATFDIVGSNAKIKRVTGWRPRVSLEQSLKNTLRYYREL